MVDLPAPLGPRRAVWAPNSTVSSRIERKFRTRSRLICIPHPCSVLRAYHIAVYVYFCSSQNEPGIVQLLKRSEEHTSELQSLMRISYAVFCLKKKTNLTE